jgi:hypothetical protein
LRGSWGLLSEFLFPSDRKGKETGC